MFVEQLDNELIKYENMRISFDNRKVLSDFNLSVKKSKSPPARKSGVEKLLFKKCCSALQNLRKAPSISVTG